MHLGASPYRRTSGACRSSLLSTGVIFLFFSRCRWEVEGGTQSPVARTHKEMYKNRHAAQLCFHWSLPFGAPRRGRIQLNQMIKRSVGQIDRRGLKDKKMKIKKSLKSETELVSPVVMRRRYESRQKKKRGSWSCEVLRVKFGRRLDQRELEERQVGCDHRVIIINGRALILLFESSVSIYVL